MLLQWNLYNETGKVLLKTHKFHHLPGTVFTKACLVSLSWDTTCLVRPQILVVALYRFFTVYEIKHVLCLIPVYFHLSLKLQNKFVDIMSLHFYNKSKLTMQYYIDGVVQDCSISIANALEILQSCT